MQSHLIFGAGGQDGLILTRRLTRRGEKVTGVVHNESAKRRIEAYAPSATIVVADVRDEVNVAQVVADSSPSHVYNFAAVSSVARSWMYAAETMSVNLLGVANILGALRVNAPDHVRLFQASSSEIFGGTSKPLNEDSQRSPSSPYGVSKNSADQLVSQFRTNFGLFATTGIFFNHESPLRPESFLSRRVSRGIAEISVGERRTLTLGNLDAVRDWGYAPDYVNAAELIINASIPDDYVVATGSIHSVRDVLDIAFHAIGVDDWSPFVEEDETLLRPADHEFAQGDATKLRYMLGWLPSRSFAEVLVEMIQHDIDLVTRKASVLWEEPGF